MKQDDVFIDGEGDRWYCRNKEALKTNRNPVLEMMIDYNINPTRILDVGCADGTKLEAMREQFNCEAYGIDASLTAILEGREKYPNLTLTRGGIATCNYNTRFFDCITASFVFHWIDRNNLLPTCARIDSYLKWGGYLIISDFDKFFPRKRKYHHLDADVYTYKQYYPDIFLSTANYKYVKGVKLYYDETDSYYVVILQKIQMALEEKVYL